MTQRTGRTWTRSGELVAITIRQSLSERWEMLTGPFEQQVWIQNLLVDTLFSSFASGKKCTLDTIQKKDPSFWESSTLSLCCCFFFGGGHWGHEMIMTWVIPRKRGGWVEEFRSKLCLVDLAGSERAHDTGLTGVGLEEGIAINQSLSALGCLGHLFYVGISLLESR